MSDHEVDELKRAQGDESVHILDEFAKKLAIGVPRRTLLKGLAGSALGGMFAAVGTGRAGATGDDDSDDSSDDDSDDDDGGGGGGGCDGGSVTTCQSRCVTRNGPTRERCEQNCNRNRTHCVRTCRERHNRTVERCRSRCVTTCS